MSIYLSFLLCKVWDDSYPLHPLFFLLSQVLSPLYKFTVEATTVAGPDGGQVLGSLHARGRRTTDARREQRGQQQADLITVCIKTAVVLAAEGLGRLSDLLPDIFRRNGLPPLAISPELHPPTTKTENEAADWHGAEPSGRIIDPDFTCSPS